jgi:PleD family two-component response regulator
LQDALAARTLGDEGPVTLSGGVAELTPDDDPGTFVARANGALGLAKQAGRGTLVGGPLT